MEVHTTDNELHDMIVPTVNEQYNEDDHYGPSRPVDDQPYDRWEGEGAEALNEWGDW